MPQEDLNKQFQDYLDKINDIQEDKCWFCGKTPHQIREEFFKYMANPSEEYEDIDLEDIVIMTYKLKKPICAGCYFTIKKQSELVQEIIDTPMDEIW